jgi:hypothetical protein
MILDKGYSFLEPEFSQRGLHRSSCPLDFWGPPLCGRECNPGREIARRTSAIEEPRDLVRGVCQSLDRAVQASQPFSACALRPHPLLDAE